MGGSLYIPHTLDPLEKLNLDFHKVSKLGLKLNEHFVQCAYKLGSTRRALEKSIDNSRHNSQVGGSARHPPDPYWALLFYNGEEDTWCLGPRCLSSLNWCRECFTAYVVFFLFFSSFLARISGWLHLVTYLVCLQWNSVRSNMQSRSRPGCMCEAPHRAFANRSYVFPKAPDVCIIGPVSSCFLWRFSKQEELW